MKTASLETLVAAWATADHSAKAAAIAALRNRIANPETETRACLRWAEVAQRLGVSKRSAFSAAKNAGITPVRLPGRTRAIGIRAGDLALLVGG